MEKSKPVISIIIPFYNTFVYIEELIKSIPQNDVFEVIIVDDKSVEAESQALIHYIEGIKNLSISYYYNNRTKSAGTCRNIGLENAKGEWVLFADSDDCFTKDLETIVLKWTRTEYDLVFFSPTSYDYANNKIGSRHLVYEQAINDCVKNPDKIINVKTTFVVPWSKLIRRKLIVENNIKFDQVIASNDVMFSLKCSFAASRIGVTQETIYCVNKRENSLLFRTEKSALEARADVYIRQYHFLKSNLDKKTFDELDMRGTSVIKRYIAGKMPPLEIIKIYIKLRKNGVKVLDIKALNPKAWFKLRQTMRTNDVYRQGS